MTNMTAVQVQTINGALSSARGQQNSLGTELTGDAFGQIISNMLASMGEGQENNQNSKDGVETKTDQQPTRDIEAIAEIMGLNVFSTIPSNIPVREEAVLLLAQQNGVSVNAPAQANSVQSPQVNGQYFATPEQLENPGVQPQQALNAAEPQQLIQDYSFVDALSTRNASAASWSAETGQPVVESQVQAVQQPFVQSQGQALQQPIVQAQRQGLPQPIVQPQGQALQQPVVQTQGQALQQPVVQPQEQALQQPIVQTQVQAVQQPMVQPQGQVLQQPEVLEQAFADLPLMEAEKDTVPVKDTYVGELPPLDEQKSEGIVLGKESAVADKLPIKQDQPKVNGENRQPASEQGVSQSFKTVGMSGSQSKGAENSYKQSEDGGDSTKQLFELQQNFRNAVSSVKSRMQKEVQKPTEEIDVDKLQSQVNLNRSSQEFAVKKTEAAQLPEPKILDQLATGIKEKLTKGEGEYIMKLKPEALGEITLKLVEKGGKTAVTILTASAQTAKLINAELSTLRDTLRPMSVEVRDAVQQSSESSGSQLSFDFSSQQFSHREQAFAQRDNLPKYYRAESDEQEIPLEEQQQQQLSGLNIIV